ncbi:MAG: DUF4197 domain-containing protein [Chromatiales bacterium]|jgi:hypothetical protein|nr:DUF4197 domain-containing protein [Chromatiales bacterium]
MSHLLSTLALSVALLALPTSSLAQSWLEKGSSLLKGFGFGESELANDEIVAGLKEALKIGTGTVVGQLGAVNGFNADPVVRIPLPDTLTTVRNALAPFGLSGMLDDLETRLNRAAEDATPKAKAVFWDAISVMTLDDARKILDGADDSATRYFQSKMSNPLAREWRPIVDRSLTDVGAIRAYEDAIGEYAKLPFVPDVRANLTEYVIEKGLDGVFHYLAQEEADIRNNPLKRSTELLQKVFGVQ